MISGIAIMVEMIKPGSSKTGFSLLIRNSIYHLTCQAKKEKADISEIVHNIYSAAHDGNPNVKTRIKKYYKNLCRLKVLKGQVKVRGIEKYDYE